MVKPPYNFEVGQEVYILTKGQFKAATSYLIHAVIVSCSRYSFCFMELFGSKAIRFSTEILVLGVYLTRQEAEQAIYH